MTSVEVELKSETINADFIWRRETVTIQWTPMFDLDIRLINRKIVWKQDYGNPCAEMAV